jgi:hypothetical protein
MRQSFCLRFKKNKRTPADNQSRDFVQLIKKIKKFEPFFFGKNRFKKRKKNRKKKNYLLLLGLGPTNCRLAPRVCGAPRWADQGEV